MINLTEGCNTAAEIEIRKYQSVLITTSNAVLIFGAWSFVRSFIMTVFGVEGSYDPDDGLAATIIGFALATAIDLAFRMRIYRGARNDVMMGSKKKNLYLVYVLILIIISIAVIGIHIYTIFRTDEGNVLNSVVQITIELTYIAISYQLIRSAFRLRGLRKQEIKALEAEHI